MYKLVILLVSILFSVSASAHGTVVESMHENGKIYPVIIVVAVIFIGIVFFLIRQERKIKQLENEIKEQKNA